MMGREVYANPYILTHVDSELFQADSSNITREELILKMDQYIKSQTDEWFRPWHAIRHMLGLYQGKPGGKMWRRYLSQNGTGKNARSEVLLESLDVVQNARIKTQTRQIV